MAQHRAWQEKENRRLCEEVMDEAWIVLSERGFGPRFALPFEERES
jgi:hypothetical protein